MSNELTIPSNDNALAVTDKAFDDVAGGNDYLPRLQLCGSNSDLAKEGKVQMGGFAYIKTKEDFLDLSDSVDCLVCGFRLKAMDLSGDTPISVFDPTDPEFVKIKEMSSVKDSGNLCGVDFLLWIPSQQSFATFYLASKSFRREAPALRAMMVDGKPGPATIASKLVKAPKFSWHVPVTKDCSTPFDLPNQETFSEVYNKFVNPPKSEVETVEEDTGRAR